MSVSRLTYEAATHFIKQMEGAVRALRKGLDPEKVANAMELSIMVMQEDLYDRTPTKRKLSKEQMEWLTRDDYKLIERTEPVLVKDVSAELLIDSSQAKYLLANLDYEIRADGPEYEVRRSGGTVKQRYLRAYPPDRRLNEFQAQIR